MTITLLNTVFCAFLGIFSMNGKFIMVWNIMFKFIIIIVLFNILQHFLLCVYHFVCTLCNIGDLRTYIVATYYDRVYIHIVTIQTDKKMNLWTDIYCTQEGFDMINKAYLPKWTFDWLGKKNLVEIHQCAVIIPFINSC